LKQNLEVIAARKRDLIPILNKFGLLENFNAGLVECYFCSEPLNWDNLGGLVVKQTMPILFCDSPDCVDKVSEDRPNE
jgi:hypothetical protein